MSIDYSNFAFPKQKTTKEKKQYRLKQKSSKLAKLERNRFSIITDKLDECYICKRKNIKLELHEVLRGRNRQKCMIWGLVVPTCIRCHSKTTSDRNLSLESEAKAIFVKKYGEEKFIEEFKYAGSTEERD